jgi:cytochrome c oxidase subunit 3
MDIALRNRVKKQLLWVALVSISMFFASMLSAFIVEKADVGNWKDFILPVAFTFDLVVASPSSDWVVGGSGIVGYFLISTAIIIISSFLLFFIKPLLKKGKSVFSLVFIVFILGILFTYFQIKGWQELTNQGVYLTGVGSNVAGSFLYILTLTHLLHLFGGLVGLCISTIKSKQNLYSINNYLGLELTTIYWHFLTILWIILYSFLKFY